MDVHVFANSAVEQGLSEAPIHFGEVSMFTRCPGAHLNRGFHTWYSCVYHTRFLPYQHDFCLKQVMSLRESGTIFSHGGCHAEFPGRKIFSKGL